MRSEILYNSRRKDSRERRLCLRCGCTSACNRKSQRENQKRRNKNVKPILANASDTRLPDRSIDLTFLFGLHYIAGGLENVISEIHCVLKPESVLSFEKPRGQ